MDFDAYLARFGVDARPAPTFDGLSTLISAHVLNVPFENFNIPLGHGVPLEPEALFDKIVRRRRGGYCFELNGLFGLLLDDLGFERRPVLARVWYRDPVEVPALTHVLNLVKIDDEEFLVDVGFGGSTARVPVPFFDGAETEDADGQVRLYAVDTFGFMLERETNEGWAKQFSITGETAYASDLDLGNHFTSSSPKTHFTHSIVAGRSTPDGRIGLVDRKMTVRRGWDAESHIITDDDEWVTISKEQFGIDVGDEFPKLIAALPAPDKPE